MAFFNREEVLMRLIEMAEEFMTNIDQLAEDSPREFAIAQEMVEQLQEELQSLL